MGHWLGLSLVIHVLLLVILKLLAVRIPEFSSSKKDYVEIEMLPETHAPTLRQDNKKDIVERSLIPEKQIVEQDEEKPINHEIPDNTRFLSAHNQRVEKQTRSTNYGTFRNARVGNWKNFQPRSAFENRPQDSEEDSGHTLALRPSKNTRQPAQVPPKRVSLEEAFPGPTTEESELGSATMDYLPDIDPGLETLLSTREFVYYTFFKRMRQQLAQYWTPQVRGALNRIYQSGRRIASNQALVTRCLVLLDGNGSLRKVYVLGESGFRELDQAAFSALKEAGPFRNPPKGLIDKDGYIRIRWDFIIEG